MSFANMLLKVITHFDYRKLDNRGALLLPIQLKLKDEEYRHYRQLVGNLNIKEVTADDLPDDFSDIAVKLVDTFRKKTSNLPYEIMLYFDYKTGEIIYCFVNDEIDETGEVNVSGEVDRDVFIGKHIASIHNHPYKFTTPPSIKNFQILELDFEDYEIICGWEEIWVVESKDLLMEGDIDKIHDDLDKLYNYAGELNYNSSIEELNKFFGNLLLNYFSKNKHVNLVRRSFK